MENPNKHPQDRDDAHADGAHHEHVEHALDPDHASVEEGQTRRHEQHQAEAISMNPVFAGESAVSGEVVMPGGIGVSSR
jgi:hypothetical protein